jgi:hypothetical protein
LQPSGTAVEAAPRRAALAEYSVAPKAEPMQNVRAARPCLASHLITVHAAHHALDRLPLLLLHSEIDPRNCTGSLNGTL